MLKAIENVKPVGVLATKVNSKDEQGITIESDGDDGAFLRDVPPIERETAFPEEFERNEDGSVITIDKLIDSINITDESVRTESLFTESQVLDIVEHVTQRIAQEG